jgi:cholest-4-en-3-one 26-monooxygenase
MAQGVREMINDEAVAAQVAAGCERGSAGLATEEILRFVSPVMQMARVATRENEIRGQRINENAVVVLWYAAGNRDLAVFADPHWFDASRSPNPHQVFGAGGPHFCLGASLARLEARIHLEALHARGLQYKPAGEPLRDPNPFINRPKSLPVARV